MLSRRAGRHRPPPRASRKAAARRRSASCRPLARRRRRCSLHGLVDVLEEDAVLEGAGDEALERRLVGLVGIDPAGAQLRLARRLEHEGLDALARAIARFAGPDTEEGLVVVVFVEARRRGLA